MFEPDEFDQVVECSVAVESGSLVAAGCTDYFSDAVRIKIAPGPIEFASVSKVLPRCHRTGLRVTTNTICNFGQPRWDRSTY